jgi:ABC-type multidrug transport system ATPase subunit
VSIASELIADPSLFFLDEPTSGLDPGLEKRMMYTLRYLADSGRTVVLVTHATANITQCDLVAFMADGRLVYYGPPAGALQMFGADQRRLRRHLHAPARPRDAEQAAQSDLSAEYEIWQQYAGARSTPTMAELWEIRFRGSEYFRTYVWERQRTATGRASRRHRHRRADGDRARAVSLQPHRPAARGRRPACRCRRRSRSCGSSAS